MTEQKKYSVIYGDPPWNTKAGRKLNGYKTIDGRQIWNGVDNKSRELEFNTMTLNEISALPVKEIADKDAHLYLWVTNQYLLKSEAIIKAWGFEYSTTLTWCKNAMGGGLGGNYRITTEFLLFCTRGSLKAKEKHTGTWFHQKREYQNGYPCHSRKPEFFAKLIEKVSPGPYLELFARRERDGWDVFGNEVESSIELPNVQVSDTTKAE